MNSLIFAATPAIGRSGGDTARAWLEALGIVLFAALFTAFPIVADLASQPLAMGICALATFLLANYVPALLPAVLVFSYLFQNSIVSLVSPWIAGVAEFGPIRGFAFLETAVAWLVVSSHYWSRRGAFDPGFRTLMTATTIAIGLTGFYFVYGLATAGSNAVIYLRNIAGPLFLFQIFGIAAQRCTVRFDGPIRLMALLLLLAGYFELMFRDEWLTLMNGRTYWSLNSVAPRDYGSLLRAVREAGRVYVDVKDLFRVQLFNWSYLSNLNITVLRLAGPNYHWISFGYALAFMVLYMAVWGGIGFVLLAVPLLVFASAKGSILLVVATLLGLAAARIFRSSAVLLGYGAVLCVLAIWGIVTGLAAGDYHVDGFFGGVAGFFSNPLGHGLGSGGNLATDFSTLDWDEAQALGQSAAAVESAIGVLLYQMGIAAIVLVAVYLRIALAAWRSFLALGLRSGAMLAFALAAILMNGIFQEEALFAPLALALITGLAGLVLGSPRGTA